MVLVLYGFIPCLQPISDFGRVYAVYGGFFIALSYLWGERPNKKPTPIHSPLGLATDSSRLTDRRRVPLPAVRRRFLDDLGQETRGRRPIAGQAQFVTEL